MLRMSTLNKRGDRRGGPSLPKRHCLPGCACGKHGLHSCAHDYSEELTREERRMKFTSRGMLGKRHPLERRLRLGRKGIKKPGVSEANARRLLDGSFWTPLRLILHTRKSGIVKVRSPLEKRFVELLEGDVDVLEYLYEVISISYVFEGRERRAVPDFLVRRETYIEIVEVKLEKDLDKRTRVRFVALDAFAQRYGLTFRWWDGLTYREITSRDKEESYGRYSV